jgi:flagellar biosynthesis/type III secretory pathway chaperone
MSEVGTSLAPADRALLSQSLRQLIAVMERERQALASLDADDLFLIAREKEELCDRLGHFGREALDKDTCTLAETASRLNEVNRRVRNLLAANVAARIEALGGVRRASMLNFGARI